MDRLDKFAWDMEGVTEIKIFYVWKDHDSPDSFQWVFAKRQTSQEQTESGVHSDGGTPIDTEEGFLGIPVSDLQEGAYNQHGQKIEPDDLLAMIS